MCTSQDPQHYMEYQHTKKRPDKPKELENDSNGKENNSNKEETKKKDDVDVDAKIAASIRDLGGGDEEDDEEYAIKIGPDKIDLLVERAKLNREKAKRQDELEWEQRERERKLQEERDRQKLMKIEQEKKLREEQKKKIEEEQNLRRQKELASSLPGLANSALSASALGRQKKTPVPSYSAPVAKTFLSIEDMVADSSSPGRTLYFYILHQCIFSY